MAALTDAGVITGELLERTRELGRHMDSADGDFRTIAFLADEIAELADGLAATFVEIDEVLTRSPFDYLASNLNTEPTTQPSEGQPSEAEGDSPQPRAWLARLLRPARWLGGRLRGVRQVPSSRGPSDRPEFA